MLGELYYRKIIKYTYISIWGVVYICPNTWNIWTFEKMNFTVCKLAHNKPDFNNRTSTVCLSTSRTFSAWWPWTWETEPVPTLEQGQRGSQRWGHSMAPWDSSLGLPVCSAHRPLSYAFCNLGTQTLGSCLLLLGLSFLTCEMESLIEPRHWDTQSHRTA